MKLNLFRPTAALAMILLSAACADESLSAAGGAGGGTGGGTAGSTASSGGTGGGTSQQEAPIVLSTTPPADAVSVGLNSSVRVDFSMAMAPATLDPTTFTLTAGAGELPVDGSVVTGGSTAVFWPAAHLAPGMLYTATVTIGAQSAAGVPLEANHVWTFTTGDAVTPGLPVDLGAAGDEVILAKSAISTVPTSVITGNVALSPAAASFITGFSLSMDAGNVFSTSPQVTGKVFAADYAPPTPSNLTVAVGDMELAFTDASARAPDVTELGAGNIGGMTLSPGVYKWGTGLLIPTSVTLAGSATDVWIFQIAQDLTVSSAASIVLQGGALPKNVFWQVSGLVDLGTTAHLEGVVLGMTSITLGTGASVHGRLMAQTAVSLDASTVTEPAK